MCEVGRFESASVIVQVYVWVFPYIMVIECGCVRASMRVFECASSNTNVRVRVYPNVRVCNCVLASVQVGQCTCKQVYK